VQDVSPVPVKLVCIHIKRVITPVDGVKEIAVYLVILDYRGSFRLNNDSVEYPDAFS
jgi:hypothetical protein